MNDWTSAGSAEPAGVQAAGEAAPGRGSAGGRHRRTRVVSVLRVLRGARRVGPPLPLSQSRVLQGEFQRHSLNNVSSMSRQHFLTSLRETPGPHESQTDYSHGPIKTSPDIKNELHVVRKSMEIDSNNPKNNTVRHQTNPSTSRWELGV